MSLTASCLFCCANLSSNPFKAASLSRWRRYETPPPNSNGFSVRSGLRENVIKFKQSLSTWVCFQVALGSVDGRARHLIGGHFDGLLPSFYTRGFLRCAGKLSTDKDFDYRAMDFYASCARRHKVFVGTWSKSVSTIVAPQFPDDLFPLITSWRSVFILVDRQP